MQLHLREIIHQLCVFNGILRFDNKPFLRQVRGYIHLKHAAINKSDQHSNLFETDPTYSI